MSEQLVSKIPAAQDALKAQLDAAFADLVPRAKVSLGSPSFEENLDEVRVAGDVDPWTISEGTFGGPDAASQFEEFTLTVEIDVRSLTSFTEARTRLFALIQRVKNALHADDTLGGSVLETQLRAGPIRSEKQTDRYTFEANLRIECEAQLTA